MKYAKIENNIVTEIKDNVTVAKVFTRLRYKLSLHKRIDQLEIQPEVGWNWDPDSEEFSE